MWRRVRAWWLARRRELAYEQLQAGTAGDEQFEDRAIEQPLFSGTANEHRFFRRSTRSTTRTEWRGD